MTNSAYSLALYEHLKELNLFKDYYNNSNGDRDPELGKIIMKVKVAFFNKYFEGKRPHCKVCNKEIIADYRDVVNTTNFFKRVTCGDHKFVHTHENGRKSGEKQKINFVFEYHNCQDCGRVVQPSNNAKKTITFYKSYKLKKWCDECRNNHSIWRRNYK